MKKWVWVGFAGVVLLWLLGAGIMLPSLQSKLEKAAKAELAKPEYTNAFDDVQVAFSGQEATLTGKVSSQQEHDQAGEVVADNVRVADAPGSSLNPVTNVINHVGVDYGLGHQRPKPWLLVARMGSQATVAGILPVEWKEQATKVLTAKLAGAAVNNQINTRLAADAKPRPAADANATLDTKSLPAFADGDIAVSSLDGHWASLKAASRDADVSDSLASANADFSAVAEALAPLRAAQAIEIEKARQATLPPGYAGVTALPESLNVYGLVGDMDSQRKLLAMLNAAYPKRKVLTNAVKISADIRAEADWASSVSTLPKVDGEAFIAAFKAGAKPVIWDGKGDLAAMQKALGAELPTTFAFAELWQPYDSWQKAKNAPPPPAPAPAAPAPLSVKIAPPVSITPPTPAPTLTPAAPAAPVNPTPVPIKIAPAVSTPPAPAPAPAAAPSPAAPAAPVNPAPVPIKIAPPVSAPPAPAEAPSPAPAAPTTPPTPAPAKP